MGVKKKNKPDGSVRYKCLIVSLYLSHLRLIWKLIKIKRKFLVNIPSQQLSCSLMYLAILTRPNMSQFNSCFTESQCKQAKIILDYLQYTKIVGPI